MRWSTQTSRRYIYSIGLLLVIVAAVLYGGTFVANMWLDQRTQTKTDQLNQVEAAITKIGSEKAFFSYKFAEWLVKKWGTKRSEHITALIEVLKKVQNNNYVGSNVIQLSDFTISPTKLSLKGKVTNLILLYYSSPEKGYTSLIDRFAELPFVSNIAIKKYNKIGDYYEFTLTADINPNAIIQHKSTNTTVNTGTTIVNTGTNLSWTI